MLQVVVTGKAESDEGWHAPTDYHVTCLFVGKDQARLSGPIYKAFK